MNSPKSILLTFVVFAAIFWAGAVRAELVRATVLETPFSDSLNVADPTTSDRPAGWDNWKSTPEARLFYDKTFGRNDTFSIGIENARLACWMNEVTVTPGATYRFSGYVKTDSNSKGAVSLRILPKIIDNNTKKASQLAYQQAGSEVINPGDWEYIEVICQMPISGEYQEGKLNKILLICQVVNSSGKVWFDDLRLDVIEIADPFVANFKEGNKSLADWKIYFAGLNEGIATLAYVGEGYSDAGALAVEYVSGASGYAAIPKDPILRRELDGTKYWTLVARARSAGDAKPGLAIEQLNEAGKVISTFDGDKYPAKDARWQEIKLPFILNDTAVAIRPLLFNNNKGQAIFDNVYLRRANPGETAALLESIKPVVWMILFPADSYAYIDKKPAALTLPSGQAISFFIQLAGDTKAAGDIIVDIEMPDSLALLAATASGNWSDNEAVPFEKIPSAQAGHMTYQFKNPYKLESQPNPYTGLMLTVKSDNPAGDTGKIVIRTKLGQVAGETRELPFFVRERIARVPKINDFKIGIWNLTALCNRDDLARKELFQTYIDAGVVTGKIVQRHAFATPLMREQGFTPMSEIPGAHEQWAFNFLPKEKRPEAMVLADGRTSSSFNALGQLLSDKAVIANYKERVKKDLLPDVNYAIIDIELWADGDIKNSCFHPSTVAEFRKYAGIADGTELNARIILENHFREWAAFRHYVTAKLHGNARDYVREIRPGAQLLAYDYLLQRNGQVQAFASTSPMNTLENDKYVDVHLISTYNHEGTSFLDSVDSTVKHLKKPVWTVPYISEILAAIKKPSWTYHHPATQELRMEVVGAAASGAKGFLPFSGILLDGDRLSAINGGALAVAKYQDFYSKGTRADDTVTLLNPDKDVRHRVHELDGKTLLTLFNCGANPAKVNYQYKGVSSTVDIPKNDFKQIEIAIFAGNALFAEDSSALNPRVVNDWKALYGSRPAVEGEDALVCRGNSQLVSKDSITIEKDKSYKLSGSFKLAPDSKPSKFYFGIMPLDDKNLQIPVQSVNTVAGTETELAADCVADDTAIKIKNGEKWEAIVNGYIAFNIDGSGKKTDLPNRELSSMGITKLEKDGDVFKVTLKDKCGKAYPAGTKIRMHKSSGQYMYIAATNQDVPADWKEFSGVLKKENCWPGTCGAKIIIMANYAGKPDQAMMIKDVKLEEVK